MMNTYTLVHICNRNSKRQLVIHAGESNEAMQLKPRERERERCMYMECITVVVPRHNDYLGLLGKQKGCRWRGIPTLTLPELQKERERERERGRERRHGITWGLIDQHFYGVNGNLSFLAV